MTTLLMSALSYNPVESHFHRTKTVAREMWGRMCLRTEPVIQRTAWLTITRLGFLIDN